MGATPKLIREIPFVRSDHARWKRKAYSTEMSRNYSLQLNPIEARTMVPRKQKSLEEKELSAKDITGVGTHVGVDAGKEEVMVVARMMPFRMVMKAAGDTDDTGEDKEMSIAMRMGIGSDIIVDTDDGDIESTTTTVLDMDAIEAVVVAVAEAGAVAVAEAGAVVAGDIRNIAMCNLKC